MGAELEPNYLSLVQNGVLQQRVHEAKKHITECNLCPHECGILETRSPPRNQRPQSRIPSNLWGYGGKVRVRDGIWAWN